MVAVSMKKRIIGGVCFLFSAALVVWLISRMDMEEAREALRQAQWPWLLGALLATCAIPLSASFRWMGVLRAVEGLRFPYGGALRAVLMANVLNSFLPSKAGDGAKAVYLRQHGGLSMGVGTVILERAVDFSVLGLLGMAGYFTSGALWGLFAGAFLLGSMVTLFSIILLFPVNKLPLPEKILGKLDSLGKVFRCWVRHPGAMAQTLAGSLCTWSMAGLTVCCLSSAFQTGIPWGYAYGVFPLAILAGLIPVTVSGVGTRDSAFVFLLSAHSTVEGATLVGLGYTVFGYWILSLISLPVVFVELRRYWKKGEI